MRERVRRTIGQVGGYWRPLAAVARLLEELSELAELDRSDPRYASELADLWIITTALSDQFLGTVVEPDSYSLRRPPSDLLGALVAAAGPIARIVNYYDGPKTPRDSDGWVSLSDAVADFHRALSDAAQAHDVDLAEAVNAKLDAIPALDAGRFQASAHDPSTAASLQRFRSLQEVRPPPSADARWWGSPDCSSQTADAQVIATDLISFTRASTRERLEAYLILGPTFVSPAQRHDWLTRLLLDIAASDPSGGENTLAELRDGAESPFVFNGLRLLVSTFDAPPPAAGTFALLQVRDAARRPAAQ